MVKALVFDAYGTLYDVQSVAGVIDAAFPGHGDYVTQVWRLKQLEYSWLRSMMGRYEDFWTVTREALGYALATLGITLKDELLAEIAEAYNRLRPYPDAEETLAALAGGRRLAILSNGSPDMLAALVRNSSLDAMLDSVMSTDGTRRYKPDPRAYEVVERTLGLPPREVLFVSSNSFDVVGAKNFGFRVARVERLPAAGLRDELATDPSPGPLAMFKALRLQNETIGEASDFTIPALSGLVGLLGSLEGAVEPSSAA